MWKSLKTQFMQNIGKLRDEAEAKQDNIRVKEKFIKFLNENPDVDHYLDVTGRENKGLTLVIGLILGFIAGSWFIMFFTLMILLNII